MPAVASILNILNSGASQKNNNAPTAQDNFSALLNVGIKAFDSEDKSSQPDQKKEDDNYVVSLGAPATFYAADKNEKLKDISVRRSDAVEPEPEKEQNSAPLPKADKADSRPDPKNSSAPRSNNDKPAQDNPAVANDDNVAKSANDSGAPKQEQAPVVKTEVDNLADEAARAAAAEAAVQPTTLPGANVDPAVAPIQDKMRELIDNLPKILQSNNPAELLQAMQNFFSGIQQALADNGKQAGATNLTANPQPVALPQSQADLAEAAALTPDTQTVVQLLPLPNSGNANIANILAGKADASALQADMDKLKALLQQQLSAIKTEIPKLENSTPQIANIAKQNLLSQLDAAQATLKSITGDNDSALKQLATPVAAIASAVASPVFQNNQINNSPAHQLSAAPLVNAIGDVAEKNAGSNDQGSSSKDGQPQTVISSLSASATHSADKSSHTSFAKIIAQQSNAPVMEQVAFQIKSAAKDGSSKINIQLDPAELGKLEIKLHVAADGKTGVVVTADNKDTLAMLQKDSSGLERALNDAGLKTDSGSLSFNLRGGQQERGDERNFAGNNYLKSMPEEEEILPASVISRSYVVNLSDGLDIKI